MARGSSCPTRCGRGRNDAHGCVASARAALPGVDAVPDRVVNIPIGWWLSEEDRTRVADAIKSGW